MSQEKDQMPYDSAPTFATPPSAAPPYGVQDPEKQQQQAYTPYPTDPAMNTGYAPYPTAPAPNMGYTPYPMAPAATTVVLGRPPVSNPPRDYLVWSIITTICCCFWFGIVAIIKSVRARDAISNGDRVGAMEASKMAKLCNILGTVFGIITIIGIIVYYVVFYQSLANSYSYYG